jgi:molecular chaperone GrpE
MTSARSSGPSRPAGAPDGWDRKPPAGAPQERADRQDATPEATVSEESKATADEERVEADLDALLGDVKRERDEYLELAQRARADFENYRKRAARETADAERRGKTSLARELLPALDNLERALAAAGDGDTAPDALAEGLSLMARELRDGLSRVGVEAYEPTGEPFDPTWHEALSTRAADGVDSGIVLETVQKGYRLDGLVLRPARVVVSG